MSVTIDHISLTHREDLYRRLRAIRARISEFSFANLYLFRSVHQYRLIDEDGCLRITGFTNDGASFFLPLCRECEPDPAFLRTLMEAHGIIYPVPAEWLPCFPESDYVITHNENDSDYIYTVEKMASYPGRKLHKKRNLLKQFHETHAGSQERLSAANIDAALMVLDGWHRELAHEGKTDYEEVREGLSLMDSLGLEGMVFFADGKPAGFIIGEDLTDDTHVLHFAKALTEFKGVYQYMFNEYAKSLVGRIQFLNFEQDLGLQSLRQAKSSYMPDMMELKYRVDIRRS